jgi:hypothetical protein
MTFGIFIVILMNVKFCSQKNSFHAAVVCVCNLQMVYSHTMSH